MRTQIGTAYRNASEAIGTDATQFTFRHKRTWARAWPEFRVGVVRAMEGAARTWSRLAMAGVGAGVTSCGVVESSRGGISRCVEAGGFPLGSREFW